MKWIWDPGSQKVIFVSRLINKFPFWKRTSYKDPHTCTFFRFQSLNHGWKQINTKMNVLSLKSELQMESRNYVIIKIKNLDFNSKKRCFHRNNTQTHAGFPSTYSYAPNSPHFQSVVSMATSITSMLDIMEAFSTAVQIYYQSKWLASAFHFLI